MTESMEPMEGPPWIAEDDDEHIPDCHCANQVTIAFWQLMALVACSALGVGELIAMVFFA